MKINTQTQTVIFHPNETLKEVFDYLKNNVPDWEKYTIDVEQPTIIRILSEPQPIPCFPNPWPVSVPCYPYIPYNPLDTPYKITCKV